MVYLLSTLLIFTSIPWQSVTAEENKTNVEVQKEVIENAVIEGQTSSVNGGEQEEIVSLRSETSKTYSNPDSTYTTEISEEPIHYKENEEDDWLPIDNTLVADAAEGTVVNKANSFKAEFNEQTTPNEAIVEVKQDEFSVSLTPVGPDEIVSDTVETNLETVDGVADENTIVYSDVYPNVDIKYTVGTDKVKEDIILKEKPKPNTPTSFSFVLDLNGLSYKVMENNQVMLLDKKTQEPVFYLEAPFMYDAYKPEGYKENPGVTSFSEETLSYDISMSVEQREDQLFIELVPNREWLDSEERVYPVVIDPTIAKFQPQAKLEDTNIRSHFPNNTGGAETTLGVGLYQDTAQTNNIRSLLKFDMSSIPTGTKVIDANLNMWLSSVWNDTKLSVDLHQASTNWTEGGATWLKRDGINTWNKSGGDYLSTLLSSADVSGLTDLSVNYKWSVPATSVQRWIHDSSTNKGLLLKANNEMVKSWKKFVSSDDASLSNQTPMLAVTYTSGSRLGLENYWSYYNHDLADSQGYVNLGTGNLVVSSTDFSLSGRGNSGFSFNRTYNSKAIEHSAMGYGWAFSGSETLTEYTNGNILFQESDGTTHLFSYDKLSSKYTTPTGLYLNLTKSLTGNFTLTDSSGYLTVFLPERKDTQTESAIYKIAYEEDRNKNRITYKRQTDGTLSGITDATGRTLSFQYQNKRIISTSFEGTKKNAYTYDTSGRLKTSTKFTSSNSTIGSVTTYQYNTAGLLSGIVDANGAETKYFYEDSYLKTIEQPEISDENSIINYDYSNLSSFTSIAIDAKGSRTTYKMDPNYLVTSITDSLGYTTSYKYDNDYNLLVNTDSKGNTATNTYDTKGNLLSTTDSLGNKKSYTYNEFSQPIAITDAKGTITYSYNKAVRILTETNLSGEVTTYTYEEPYGNLKSQMLPDGSIETYEYDDGQNYLTKATDSLNRNILLSYDKYGNETQIIDAEGNITKYTYDEKGQLTSITDPKNAFTSYTYDANGNLTVLKNSADKLTRLGYNNQNQLISRVEPLGQSTKLRYDANGNLVEIIQPNGNTVIRNDYNSNNLPIATRVNDELKWKYLYDQNGNRTSVENLETGATQIITYDVLNRLKTESRGNQFTNYTYSPTGEIISIKADSKLYTFTQKLEYDVNNKLKSIYRNGAFQVGMDYTDAGLLSERRRTNGIHSFYSYDEGQQLKTLKVSKGDAVLLQETNSYDLNGNLTAVTSSSGQKIYDYDKNNQLVKQTIPFNGLIESYSYDLVGNRLSKTTENNGISKIVNYSYDANNRLITSEGKNYTYDANGNRLKDGKHSYTYNDFDQLITVKTLTGTVIASYTYDDQGRRISKTANSEVTYYHYNQEGQILYETDSRDNITTEYSYDSDGMPVTLTKSNINYYYVYNSNQEIIALADKFGAIVASYTYDAWGNILSKTGAMATENPILYKGYYYDVESDFYYLISRYYQPAEGVFLSPDPISGNTGDPQSQNGYNYVSNNPLIYSDPDGHVQKHSTPGGPPASISFRVWGKDIKNSKSIWAGKVSKAITKASNDPNKKEHVLKDKHAWHLVVKDKKSWNQVSSVMSKVLKNGTEAPYKTVKQKYMKVNGQKVVVTFKKLKDGSISISDAWVATK